ncbi:DUF1702 family protein [Streptomyces sp. CB03238]|uniref:DUF1702 family protein n=1 Tax=Streptomyces sp. CB03238 TaxID=1907777 RepID=UPI000A0FD723|nr:DUF1702 family protein [Streptomyces sp. CB03238]ORT55441.1 hypothetical protein BKD26_31800 [Streptomyces sp. CB03238]
MLSTFSASPAVVPRPLRRVVIPLLRQDTAQVDFGVRRFRLRPGPARDILQAAGQAFLCGFHAALRARTLSDLAGEVELLPAERRGFAYEGAGMACGVLDLLTASRGRRFAALLTGPAARYPHLAQVGAGWAYARLGLRPRGGIPGAGPPECWLAWDGYGFHQGFFHPDRVIGRQHVERGLAPDERAIRDQGLGRALWFHECADPDGIALRIAEFPAARRGDLWSGAGLAATYAGGATSEELRRLAELAGEHRPDLAQGAAFACEAHRVSGHVPEHTAEAAPLLTGTGAEQAADWTVRSLAALGPEATGTGHYQRWRAGIRAEYVHSRRGDR